MSPVIHRRQVLLAALASIGFAVTGCESSDTADNTASDSVATDPPDTSQPTEPIAGRTVGMVATEPNGGDFGVDVIQRIRNSGAGSTSLSVYWDDIEKTPGIYAPNPNFMAIAEIFYPPFDIAVTHAFSVIDTTNKRLPPDLMGKALDDTAVITRFNAMLDWAATQMPGVNLHVISIGNEVDVYLNAHPQEWPAWQTFFQATAAHARGLWPDAVVGCKATYAGLSREPSSSALRILNENADALFVTWYGIDATFAAVAPNTLSAAFAVMIEFARGKPVRILEHGYPSAALLAGSEQLQAEFVTETFKAWDDVAGEIPHIEFFALHDFDPAVITELEAYYGLQDERFAAYLGSLGLRTWDGVDKQAWLRFNSEMAKRLAA